MKLLVDMNLSPRWAVALEAADVDACHWSTVGASAAADEEVLSWAATNGFVLLTHDLDFGTILAFSGAATPSVIQIRSEDLRPEILAGRVASAVVRLVEALAEGAIVTIEPARDRVRILPLLGQSTPRDAE